MYRGERKEEVHKQWRTQLAGRRPQQKARARRPWRAKAAAGDLTASPDGLNNAFSILSSAPAALGSCA